MFDATSQPLESAGGLPPVPELPEPVPVPPRDGVELKMPPHTPPEPVPEGHCTGAYCGGVKLTPENTFRGRRCKACRAAYLAERRSTPDAKQARREYLRRYRATPRGAALTLAARLRRDEKRRAGGYR